MDLVLPLEISPHTVKSDVIHIFNKLGINDRTQAAVWEARQHLVWTSTIARTMTPNVAKVEDAPDLRRKG